MNSPVSAGSRVRRSGRMAVYQSDTTMINASRTSVNRSKLSATLLALAITTACTQQSATPPPGQKDTPVANAQQNVAASPSTTRADAILADLARREAEYKKAEAEVAARDRQARLPIVVETSSPAPVSQASAVTTSAAPLVPATSPIAESGHDETWWKNQMRTVEVRLDEDTRRLQEARDQQRMASDQMSAATKAGAIVFAQAQEAFNRATATVNDLQATVRNDAAAVERVREDARRANVPPGWLRWP